jgi:hypothetical protein
MDALVKAKKIVVPGSTSGIYLTKELFPKLGISDQISVHVTERGAQATAVLAARDANIAVQPSSELVNVVGIDYVGPIPGDIQLVQTFAAAITIHSSNLDAAKKAEGKAMVLELQRSKTAVDQLDVRLKLLKDSGAFVFKSLEDAIIQFTRTGKLSFKDLVGTVLRGLLEMQIRAQSTKLFSMLGSMLFATPRADLIGANAVLGTNQSLDSFDFPQRAMGGSVAANDSYIVGENGPEMFVPRQSGTIVPNGQLSSMGNQPQVIYNGPYIASMSAIDTQSATQFLARNKNAVWSANQSAARGLPTSR